ncbi:MAG: hypothetical protein WB780_13830 [Candidatus Acidiferrales bacterium]
MARSLPRKQGTVNPSLLFKEPAVKSMKFGTCGLVSPTTGAARD